MSIRQIPHDRLLDAGYMKSVGLWLDAGGYLHYGGRGIVNPKAIRPDPDYMGPACGMVNCPTCSVPK